MDIELFSRSLAGIFGFQTAGIQGTLAARFFADSVNKTFKHNEAIKQMQEALALTKLPEASGGQGLVQSVYQNQTVFTAPRDRNAVNADTLERLNIIENLNKYR